MSLMNKSQRSDRLLRNRIEVEGRGGRVYHALARINAIAAELDPRQLEDLQATGNIEFVERDPIRQLFLPTAVSDVSLQAESVPYGITMVQAPQLSDSTSGTRKVCITDTGYDGAHQDLRLYTGANIGGSDNDGRGNDTGNWYRDGFGHGTHVAGTIAGLGGNGLGVVGVNPGNKLGLHIIKVFDDAGEWAYGSDMIAAVEQCVNAGANVISMSLGGPENSAAEENAFDDAYAAGVLSIAAAGNDGTTALSYPASYGSVVSVAAIDSGRRRASFSQRNSQVEIAAPGVGVLSTLPGNKYEAWSGTSMATPHVAGVAALVWGHFPSCSAAEIRAALNASAEDLGTAGRDNNFGYGLVRAKAAADYLTAHPCDGGTGPGPEPEPEPEPCESATFAAAGLPLAIPDNNATGTRATIAVNTSGTVASLTVTASITHTYRGDLVVTLVAPSGARYVLSNRAGGSADNLSINATLAAAVGTQANGNWQLLVQDRARADVGTLSKFGLSVTQNCN
jgi:serine protease